MSAYYRQQDIYLSQSEVHCYDESEQELILITQNLGKEQYRFEFPSKSSLDALTALDHGHDRFSFFDPHSFHSAEYASAQDLTPITDSVWHETVVDDSRLSPLHLPTRDHSFHSATTPSSPVNPSHFLKQASLSPASVRSDPTRVLIQLNPVHFSQPITILHSSRSTASMTDEGYDDSEEDGKELESDVCFYPLHDSRRNNAASKIQACWRAYLAKHPQHSLHARIRLLERQLQQETAMRRAFENTVENMTVLIDQQQKILYDRLQEEVLLRQSFEAQTHQALQQLGPLQQKLAQESTARSHLESTLATLLQRVSSLESQKPTLQKPTLQKPTLQKPTLHTTLQKPTLHTTLHTPKQTKTPTSKPIKSLKTTKTPQKLSLPQSTSKPLTRPLARPLSKHTTTTTTTIQKLKN